MSLAGKSLCVLTPMYNCQLFMNHHQSMLDLACVAPGSGMKSFSHVQVASSIITEARNVLALKFLQTEATHGVFIDADMGFDPRDVLRMLEIDRDVIGGCSPIKIIDWNRIQQVSRRSVRNFTDEEMQQLGVNFNFERPREERLRLDTPQKVERLGTGLLMVKREVFEKLRQAHPDRWYEFRDRKTGAPLLGRVHEFFRTSITSEHEHLGEDYTFCNDCRALGFEIWMCPWTRTTHMGVHSYVGDFLAMARLCSESAKGRKP